MRLAAVILTVLALDSPIVSSEGSARPRADQPPTPTTLTETVEKRLVQFDIAVEGDREAIRRITAKDIALYVGEREVQGLIIDPLCGDSPRPTPSPTQTQSPAASSAGARATFIFFFDQPHLTLLVFRS